MSKTTPTLKEIVRACNLVIYATYDSKTDSCKFCGAGEDGAHADNCPAYHIALALSAFQDREKAEREADNV